MKKLGILLSLCAICLVGCKGNSTNEKKQLHVITSSGYAPYEIRNAKGELEGFDIDLAEALAKEMGYDGVKWEDMDFEAVIGAISSGRGDMAIAGLSPNEKRRQSVDFSNSYYSVMEDTTNYVVTRSDSGIESTSDIHGKTVGVQIGTIQEETINGIKEEYALTTDARKSYGDMIQEIKNKRIDFIVVEKAVAEEYQKTNPELSYFQLDVEGASTGNCIAFKKGNTEMLEAVNKALLTLTENGTLDSLIQKWFQSEE